SPRKRLNITDKLIDVAPTKCIRDAVDLIGGTPDIMRSLRHFPIEFTRSSANCTGHATYEIGTYLLLLFDRPEKFFAGLRGEVRGSLGHTRSLLLHLTRD